MGKVVYYANTASIPCEGFALIVRTVKSVSDVKVFQTADRLVQHIHNAIPDLLVFDLDEKMFGIPTLRLVLSLNHTIRVLVFYHPEQLSEIIGFMDFGLAGCYDKQAPADQLLLAIDKCLSGQFAFDQAAQQCYFRYKLEKKGLAMVQGEELTEREKLVYNLLVAGKSSGVIAEQLYISTHTVHTHRKNIFRKLNIHSVTELILKAQGNKG